MINITAAGCGRSGVCIYSFFEPPPPSSSSSMLNLLPRHHHHHHHHTDEGCLPQCGAALSWCQHHWLGEQVFIFLLRVLKSSKNHPEDVQNEAGNRKGQGPPFSPKALRVFVFITKELEGQRASFLPNMMNGFFINHEGTDDGPKAFSGCSRLRGAPGSGLAPFWGRFWPFLINGN